LESGYKSLIYKTRTIRPCKLSKAFMLSKPHKPTTYIYAFKLNKLLQ